MAIFMEVANSTQILNFWTEFTEDEGREAAPNPRCAWQDDENRLHH
jgi:hypothetical protein